MLLLVPLLLLLDDVPVGVASFVMLSSFWLTGIVAVASNRHRGRRRLPRARAIRLCIAATPGALGGALAPPLLPPILISSFIAAIAILSGAHILGKAACAARQLRRAWHEAMASASGSTVWVDGEPPAAGSQSALLAHEMIGKKRHCLR